MTETEWQLAADSQAAAAGALRQLDTGGWEWTSTLFSPLPGKGKLRMLGREGATKARAAGQSHKGDAARSGKALQGGVCAWNLQFSTGAQRTSSPVWSTTIFSNDSLIAFSCPCCRLSARPSVPSVQRRLFRRSALHAARRLACHAPGSGPPLLPQLLPAPLPLCVRQVPPGALLQR